MIWRFTIIDRDNLSTVIEEPVGWDSNVAEMDRDENTHGIFLMNQGGNLEFYGKARKLIKKEYETYGAKGSMKLLIEQDCGNGFEEADTAKFVFARYEHHCDGNCFVKIPVESLSNVMDIRNRINQKVNLETDKAFDETTTLAPYTKLPFDLMLPSKGIFIQDNAETEDSSEEEFDGGLQEVMINADEYEDTNLTYEQIQFGLPDKQVSEIGGFYAPPTHLMDIVDQNSVGMNWFGHFPPGTTFGDALHPTNLSPLINYAKDSANYGNISNPLKFDIRLSGILEVKQCYLGQATIYLLRLPAGLDGDLETDYEFIAEQSLYIQLDANIPGYRPPNYGDIPFLFIYNTDTPINTEDRFYLFMAVKERKTQTEIDAVDAGAKALKLTLDNTSHIRITNLSRTTATVSKSFAINEAISRVVEVISNDNVRGFSEYFGRTDSQPYSHDADGCGSLESITDGIRIRRQENKIAGKTNLFTQSLQDIFDGLNPIHNIGAGLEADPARPGHLRYRVEPWKWFYKDDVVMNCTGIKTLSRKVNYKNIFSTFQFGYGKWEAEEYTGLDECLTDRTYRTTLSELKNDLVKLSKYVGSPYAWEVTRRKGNIDSKDWRYDKDTFIVCLKRTPSFHCIFKAADNTITFDWTGDSAIFMALLTISVANTVSNDGVYTIFSIIFNPGNVIIKITGATLTDEDAHNVSFTNPVFPAGGLYVETDNITNPENIIDPGSFYNFRITPLRNALRWYNRVAESYIKFDSDSKLIFTDGKGNYFAKGMMQDSNCRLEAAAIEENQTIDPAIFEDITVVQPFRRAETIEFSYPMNIKSYKALKVNPYGKIYFESDCDAGYGWIKSLKYKMEEGMADFVLIPSTEEVHVPFINGLAAETGELLLTEDNEILTPE
jgi:hypothetical protein